MNFLYNLVNDFKKVDTLLAFCVSSILYYAFHRNIIKSILFSSLFVTSFLVLLNILE
jgi:putative effector of murein hydrolase